jgi:hypothetical protein
MTDSRTDAQDQKLRVLLVGAGRRVQNNYLPILRCLADEFDVRGIHSRTPERLNEVARHWNVPAVPSLSSTDLRSFDVVAISVPTGQNANVLRQLLAHAAGLHLVIDTPIVANPREHGEIAPLLERFRSVTVTEDYMNFPPFSLLRQFAASGRIGELRALTLNNIGFMYHGLALVRSFVGFGPVLSATRHQIGADSWVVSYEFPGEFRASVVGPYRRHTSGGLTLDGTHGTVTEFPADLDGAKKPTYLLRPTFENDLMAGYEIVGNDLRDAVDLPSIRAMRAMDFQDKSDLNLLRSCGLGDVFRSIAPERNLNNAYGPANAFYDGFVSRRATAGAKPLDPLNIFGRQPVRGVS